MRGICGWLGAAVEGQNPGFVLERMLEPYSFPDPVSSTRAAQSAMAIGCAGVRTWLHGDGTPTVALTGHPILDDGTRGEAVLARIAAGYADKGEGVLEEIHGPFSLAILDRAADSALLATDRLGIEPLCYAIADGTLVFGSRADVVAAYPALGREIDLQSLFNYLYFHCIPAPRTVFQHVGKLLPGQCVRFRGGQFTESFYWTPDYDEAPKPYAALAAELRTRLDRAVRTARDGADAGAFLSGGTDSSTVCGILAKTATAPARSYSIGFEAEGYDEMAYARIAARHFGLDAREYYVTPQDVADAVPLVARAYDEPFGNASALPTYYCARFAAERGETTLLGGDGGDEIFAGNARYARQLLFERYAGVPETLRRRVLEPIAFGALGRIVPFTKLRSYIEQARVPLPDRLETYNLLHRTSLPEMLMPEVMAAIDVEDPLVNLRESYQRVPNASALNRMLFLDLKLTLADNDLRKVSRMCELAGIDVRYPMLDEDLVAFSARIPPSLKLRQFQLRYFFKRALADFLPPEILKKRKQGFGLPFGVWLRDFAPLQALAHESLEAFQSRGYLRPEYIGDLLRRHREEHAAYYGVMVWVLMSLELWLQGQGL